MGSQELSRTTMFCFCACIITQHALTMIVLYLRTRQSMVLSVVFVASCGSAGGAASKTGLARRRRDPQVAEEAPERPP